jgi:hypothetical protein
MAVPTGNFVLGLIEGSLVGRSVGGISINTTVYTGLFGEDLNEKGGKSRHTRDRFFICFRSYFWVRFLFPSEGRTSESTFIGAGAAGRTAAGSKAACIG